MANSAQTYVRREDRKLNGPSGFKTSALVKDGRLVWLTYWRRATDFGQGFSFKVTYH